MSIGEPTSAYGWLMLTDPWYAPEMSVPWGLLIVSWLGNLGWPMGLAALWNARSGRWAIRIGAIGLITCSLTAVVSFARLPIWPSDTYGIGSIGPGYFFWTAALAMPLIAVAVERRRRHLAPDVPLTNSRDARMVAAAFSARLANGYWRWALLSVVLYVVACAVPALEIEAGFDEIDQPMIGLSCLVNGIWIMDEGSLLTLSWLGNLGWPIGLLACLFAREGSSAILVGIVGLVTCSLTAISFVAGSPISPNYDYQIVALGPGYFLWVAALAMPLVAAMVERRRRALPVGGSADSG